MRHQCHCQNRQSGNGLQRLVLRFQVYAATALRSAVGASLSLLSVSHHPSASSNRAEHFSLRMVGARRVVIQRSPSIPCRSSRMRAPVSMPRSPTSTTRRSPKRLRILFYLRGDSLGVAGGAGHSRDGKRGVGAAVAGVVVDVVNLKRARASATMAPPAVALEYRPAQLSPASRPCPAPRRPIPARNLPG